MRIKIALYTPKLPIMYRHLVLNFLEAAVQKAGAEPALVDAGRFTFNLALPRKYFTTTETFTVLEEEVTDVVFTIPPYEHLNLYVSSPDQTLIDALECGVRLLSASKEVCGGFLSKGAIKMTEHAIAGRSIKVKICSPICINDSNGRPIVPLDQESLDAFARQFNAVHDQIMMETKGRHLHEKINIKLDSIKKKVVKHALQGERSSQGKPFVYLTSFTGTIELDGNPEDLKHLYDIGIGQRTSHGFGMVELT